MPDQLKEKISEEISQSKEKIAQNSKLHELSQDLNDLMKTVSETSNEIATGISSITAKAKWLENGNHYYFLQKIKKRMFGTMSVIFRTRRGQELHR